MRQLPRYGPAIFDGRPTLVPLGLRHQSGDDKLLTLDSTVEGTPRGVRLAPDQVSLLDRQATEDVSSIQSRDDRALLLWMANQGFVAILREGVELAELQLVPVVRRPLSVKAVVPSGYQISVGADDTVELSAIASEFLFHFDGRRTLFEIANLVKADIESDPDWSADALRQAVVAGVPVEQLILDAALSLIQVLQPIGAITLDWRP